MKRRGWHAFTITVLIGLIGFVTPTPAMAAGCMVPTAMYPTIQSAVNDPSCNPITVAPGVYPEPDPGPLTIHRSVTLLGAQAGNDARTRLGAESVINDTQGTTISGSNVVIDGFTVQDSTNPFVNGGYGILMSPTGTNRTIVNTIIQDNIIGIGLGGSNVVIRHDLIQNNTKPGAASGSGIYTDQFVGGSSVRDVLVEENDFRGHAGTGGAINISNTDFATGGVFNLDVLSNGFVANSRAFVLFNTHDSTFDGNSVSNSTFVGSADVRLFDNNTNLLFTNNDFRNGAGHAVRFSDLGLGGPSSNVDFHFNNFEVYALTGMTNDPVPPGHSGTVDAECNWWNSSTGPTSASNPGGTGEEVVGDVDFTPWLTAPAPGGPCVGGLASTPGKVTGGGQLQGDPIFSPIGELLSVPAMIVSANGSARSTFGFVIQLADAAAMPKGNLDYQDHAAGIRIKATSYDFLHIDDGICGPKTHALFTGTADVNGEPESLTVEVNDCGEPSSGPPPDTFRIQTDSYSNGGPLIGGNIQIHR